MSRSRFAGTFFAQWRVPLAAAVAASALVACGGDYTNTTSGTGTTPPAGAATTGSAYLGPITGGSAAMYTVNVDGTNNGAAVETVTTTATGFSFAHAITGPTRVCVTGGTYLDEATNTTQTSTVTLCALLGGATTTVYITPMTSFVDEIVKAQLKLKTAPTAADFTTVLAAANTLIKTVYSVGTTMDAIQPSFVATDATAKPDAYKVGAILGAYSQLISDYLARCGGDRHEILKALLKDIGDKVFDGKTVDATGAFIAVQYTCNGALVNLPLGAGTADVVTALGEFGATTQGTAMAIAANRTLLDNVSTGILTGPAAPAALTSLPSQGLIAIDTARNVGYVPIYTHDALGNGQIAVIDLSLTATTPLIKLISLTGADTAIASNFLADTGLVYVLAANGSQLSIYIIDSATNTLQSTVAATGLTFSGSFGGVIVDATRHRVVVAGTSAIGFLDISVSPPTWDSTKIINVGGTDSFSLNAQTGLVFISSDGSLSTIDTTTTPMTYKGWNNAGMGTTDGVAFDSLTGLMIVTPEFQDKAYVLNMNEFSSTATSLPTPLNVPGTGATTAPVGEGPGGQVAVNPSKHQALVADEFGHNLRLVQMPTVTPTTTTEPSATDSFTIAGTILPKPMIAGVATQLGMRGDPNSVTIDQGRNYAYVLADTQPSYHGFNVNYPLFLVRIDLTITAASGTGTAWAPSMQTIQMP